MRNSLVHLHAEAYRLLAVYGVHMDSSDEFVRQKVHIGLDRFLMEHCEIVAILLTQGLQDAIINLKAERKSKP